MIYIMIWAISIVVLYFSCVRNEPIPLISIVVIIIFAPLVLMFVSIALFVNWLVETKIKIK